MLDLDTKLTVQEGQGFIHSQCGKGPDQPAGRSAQIQLALRNGEVVAELDQLSEPLNPLDAQRGDTRRTEQDDIHRLPHTKEARGDPRPEDLLCGRQIARRGQGGEGALDL